MVSPTSTTPQPPVLSYAESAKKAQGVKPASQQHTQKPLSNPPRQLPAPASEPRKPGKPSPTAEAAQASLAVLSLHDASPPSAPGANPPARTSTDESTPTSREVATHDSPPADVVSPLLPSQAPPTKPAPVPNVWNQRIQQRAQARSQPRPPPSQPQTSSSHAPRAPSPARDPSITSSGSRQTDLVVSLSAFAIEAPSSSSSLNGASSSTSGPSTGSTPSSRKDLPLSPQPPLVNDAESWPEVGKGYVPVGKPRVSNGHAAEVQDAEKDANAPSSSLPGTPKKSASFPSPGLFPPLAHGLCRLYR